MAQCDCVMAAAGIRRCLSKDFPRAASLSNSSMCFHRSRVHMLIISTHMFLFSSVKASCIQGSAKLQY